MAQSFYYFLSSLPLLSLDEPAPFSAAEFMSSCASVLSPSDVLRLSEVSLVPGGVACCDAARGWQEWETYLRNVLARRRAVALGVDPSEAVRPEGDVFPGDRRRADAVAEGRDPLAREKDLDRMRWARLDDLAVGHDFDFDALVIYRLRLLILEKWRLRSAEKGTKNRDALVDAGVEQADRHRVTVDSQTEA
jgi:hypothetical protein